VPHVPARGGDPRGDESTLAKGFGATSVHACADAASAAAADG
jgi:hypothetical protein